MQLARVCSVCVMHCACVCVCMRAHIAQSRELMYAYTSRRDSDGDIYYTHNIIVYKYTKIC